MGPYYLFEGTPLIHARTKRIVRTASCVFLPRNAQLRIFLDRKPVIWFNITWLSTNRMEVLMYTK